MHLVQHLVGCLHGTLGIIFVSHRHAKHNRQAIRPLAYMTAVFPGNSGQAGQRQGGHFKNRFLISALIGPKEIKPEDRGRTPLVKREIRTSSDGVGRIDRRLNTGRVGLQKCQGRFGFLKVMLGAQGQENAAGFF